MEICEALGVSENTFLNWVVLIGNDYTGHFDRHTDFNIAVPSELHGYRPDVLEELLAVAAVAADEGVTVGAAAACAADDVTSIVDSVDNPEVVVSSREPAKKASSALCKEERRRSVQLAVDYTFAVYQLQDLDHFPLDASSLAEDGPDDDTDAVAHISNRFFDFSIYGTPRVGKEGSVEKGYFDTLPQYAASQAGSSGKVKLFGLAEHALFYLKHRNTVNQSNSQENVLSEDKDTDDVVTAEHLAALSVMLRQIYLHTESAKDNTNATNGTPVSAKKTPFAHAAELITAEFPYRPRWADAVAAFVFQRTCAVLVKFLPNDAYRTKNNAPRHMFNGALFHRILMLQRAAALEPTDNRSVLSTTITATTAQNTINVNTDIADVTTATTSTSISTSTSTNDSSVLSLAEAMRMLTMNNINTNNNTTASSTTTSSSTSSTPPNVTEDSTCATPAVPAEPVHDILPIDAFREEILTRIHRDRVTIIHGETGCGKSSCLPRFLLEEGERTGVPVQIMVSQPRRIAVTSLLRRLRTTLGKGVLLLCSFVFFISFF